MDIDSEFMTIEKAEYLVVLCSREEPYILNKQTDALLTKAKNILIYAESIELNGSIELPGRNIGIICHRLTVTGTSDVIIDVSGAKGAPQLAKTVGSGTKGNDGQSAGTVFISVESPTTDISRLRIRAIGGDGGQGGATSDSKTDCKGGAGGKGGDAGKITVLFNSPAYELSSIFRRRLIQARKASWYNRTIIAKVVLSDQKPSVTSIPSIDFLAALGSVMNLIDEELPESEFAQQLLSDIQTNLSQFSELETYSELIQSLQENTNTEDIRARLQSVLTQLTKDALNGQMSELRNGADILREKLIRNLDSSPGRGGRGGTSSSDLIAGGAAGIDGQRVVKGQECRYLPAPEEDFYFDLNFPTFFPDQARMLLKRADAHYLQNTEGSLAIAGRLYERLTRRLYYVPDLTSPTNISTQLAQSLSTIFEKNSICLTPLSDAQGILVEATTRLGRIQLGQDIFGQSPVWAPRLSYFYYEKRVGEMMNSYKSLTQELDTYRTKSDKADEQRTAVGKVRDLVQKEGADVQVRLDSLLGENGPLQATAYKVRVYDPKMKDQQRHLKTQMNVVAAKIKTSINLSKVIDAFTTLASSKSLLEGGKNAIKAGVSLYKSATVVQDADGKEIEKALLVKQVTTCGDTLESLTEAISEGDDGNVNLEDPGAMKVVTSKENISKMLDQFRNILPESMRKETNKQLDDFLNTVTTRNNAVLEYNALCHSVRELQSTKVQQAAMIDALSQQKLQNVDPCLPSVVNWLRRTRDDLSLAIMQQLNYASRAIRFWGLFEGLPLDKPGPLRGVVELQQIQNKLKQSFDACLTDFAGSTWDWWGSKSAMGRLYKFSEQELTALTKNVTKDDKGLKVHSIDIRLSPNTPNMAGIGSNVRIRQIRLWLANAHVDPSTDDTYRQILTVTLTHLGDESIQKDDTHTLEFTHSPVKINFRYHCGGVKSLDGAKATAVYGQQVIENDFQSPTVSNANASSIAPLGPFATWRATIREVDNPGLDLSRVSGAWLEFWGRSKP